MSVKIQLKRTTASAWTSLNPTLDNGEFGYETDTAKFKIGNGSTAWTSLAYANANLSVASLDALSDVTITSATNGDFLRWNGSAWINDAVNLSTDTVGSYVESLVAGTGVTVTNNSGEGAAPTIAIGQSVATSDVPTFAGLNLNGNIVFEGTTANDFETTISVTDPTADRTITFPDATTTVVGTDTTQTLSNKTLTTPVINGPTITATGQTPVIHGILLPATHNIIFEGTSDDAFETTLYVVDPTADRTVSLPDATTTLVGKDTTDILTNKTLTSPKINEDVALTASSTELNILDGATLSTTELNYVDGVTSAIQTQIDTKAPLASPTFTGTVTLPSGTVTSAMIADATIVDGDISASASIADTKLATISTAGKVSNSATTATATAGNSTIVARDSSGNFAAGTITAALSGNASTASTLATPRAIEISGDVTGTANFDGSAAINITATIAANSVALGTDTTGNYVNDITAGTGVTVTHTPGEGTSPTIAIGQAVATNSNVTFNDLTVSGNLTVSGTTTSINTETLTVDDNIVILNNNVTGSPTENAGIEVERGTSANVSVRWNETNDKWEITNDGTTYGNVVSTSDTGTVATAMIADSNVTTGKINDLAVTTGKINDLAVTVGKINDLAITNAKISESAAIVDTKLATISTAGKVSNSATTATDANTANAIVARDGSGNFTAGTITGSLSGNASTATTLATARNIAGQSFNGSANISIAPTDLTGVTSTAAEINILDGATLSTAELNILDGVTSSASELNILDGASLTTTELNYVDGVTSAIQTQLDTKAPLNAPTFTGTVSGISKSMVGLGNVDDTSDANKPVSTAQQNAIDLKANINSPTFTGTVSGINSTMVGLGSVNNTSDQDKPISTATQTALDLKAPLASPTFSGTPSLPTGTTAVTQTAGNNTTALATTAFIQTALGNYRRMTASDTAPSVDVTAGDFWYDTTGLNLYIYVSSAWVQVTIDEPIFFELAELIGVVIDEDLATNQTLRFDGVSGNWVNSFPRQNVSNSSLTTYGITSANNGGIVVLDSSSAVSVNLGTWTDANIGEKVDIVQKGTGQVSITVSGAVSVVSPSNSVTTRVRYSTVTATCIGANLFLLSGDLA